MKKLRYALLMTVVATCLSAGAFAEGYQDRSSTADTYSAMEPAAGDPAMHKQLGTSTVKNLQQTLDNKGFSPGPIDGIWGPKTQGAIRDFQQANGLPATGKLTSDTLAQLGVEVEGVQRPMGRNQMERNMEAPREQMPPSHAPEDEPDAGTSY